MTTATKGTDRYDIRCVVEHPCVDLQGQGASSIIIENHYNITQAASIEKEVPSMPWIKKELCTGCRTCIDECSVGAISMEENSAVIEEDECIRCGVCHDICPHDAVRHDGERIPEEVRTNVQWVKDLLNSSRHRAL